MQTFYIHVADVKYPWDLTAKELKEITETHTVDCESKEYAIDEAEGWQGECEHEWARVWITTTPKGRPTWRNWQ